MKHGVHLGREGGLILTLQSQKITKHGSGYLCINTQCAGADLKLKRPSYLSTSVFSELQSEDLQKSLRPPPESQINDPCLIIDLNHHR